MIALDTNVLVRIITNDNPEQVRHARALLRSNTCFVSVTVLLETSWVLEASYGLPISVVASSLRQFLGLEQVRTESMSEIEHALQWYEGGFDFADALHRALTPPEANALATFDQAFIQQAHATEGCPVVDPANVE